MINVLMIINLLIIVKIYLIILIINKCFNCNFNCLTSFKENEKLIKLYL